MTVTIPHEGAPLTEAPDAARTASPMSAGRVEKVGEQRVSASARLTMAVIAIAFYGGIAVWWWS